MFFPYPDQPFFEKRCNMFKISVWTLKRKGTRGVISDRVAWFGYLLVAYVPMFTDGRQENLFR